MPNQMSPDSRRVNFIWEKEVYAELEARAQKERMSVGELIRRALEDQYKLVPEHPVVMIRQHRDFPKAAKPLPRRKSLKGAVKKPSTKVVSKQSAVIH